MKVQFGKIRKIGRFYSSVIIKNIALFITYGLLSAVFSEYGWFPKENIYNMAQIIYQVLIPVCLGLTAGKKAGKEMGGLVGAITSIGVLMVENAPVITGSILLGGVGGYIADKLYERIQRKIRMGFEMLTKNVTIAIIGSIFAMLSYFIMAPILVGVDTFLLKGISELIEIHMLPLASVLIEPAKVFFLNNNMNHGILVPIGMEQIQTTGKSILFLIETNPGPGMGILMTYYILKKRDKKEIGSYFIVESLGGIHEVYFPYVLENLKLILAVIVGGMSGILCFSIFDVGVVGPVSPGSMLTIFLMTRRESFLGIFLGIIVSAIVTCIIALIILMIEKREKKKKNKKRKENSGEGNSCKIEQDNNKKNSYKIEQDNNEKNIYKKEQDNNEKNSYKIEQGNDEKNIYKMENRMNEIDQNHDAIENRNIKEFNLLEGVKKEMNNQNVILYQKIDVPKKIYFICDAGLGSSAMGASLLRKRLRQEGIESIQVVHSAVDDISEEIEFLICQKEFFDKIEKTGYQGEIYMVEGLLNISEYEPLIQKWKEAIKG